MSLLIYPPVQAVWEPASGSLGLILQSLFLLLLHYPVPWLAFPLGYLCKEEQIQKEQSKCWLKLILSKLPFFPTRAIVGGKRVPSDVQAGHPCQTLPHQNLKDHYEQQPGDHCQPAQAAFSQPWSLSDFDKLTVMGVWVDLQRIIWIWESYLGVNESGRAKANSSQQRRARGLSL